MIKRIKYFRNYLAYQIFASFMITVAIVLMIALALPNFDARIFSHLEQNQRQFFAQESRHLVAQYDLDEIFRRGLSVISKNGFDVILLEPESHQIAGINEEKNSALQAFIFKANDFDSPLQRRFGKLEFYGPFLVETHQHRYYQYFAKEVSPQKEFVNYMFDSPWLMILLILVVSTPGMFWLANQIAKPVKELRLTANAVAMGNLTVNPQLETRGILELRQVGKSFNQMITALQRLNTYQQRLLSDISHELKTPLTRMQLAVSIIRRRVGEQNELSRIENEIQKLDTMIHDLLVLSRKQVNQHLTREIFPVNRIWENILDDARFELGQNQLSFIVKQKIDLPEHYLINGNLTLLSSAVENVIRNAKKYASHIVKLTTDIENDTLLIRIDDDGQGVPEDQYEEIFRPFYRVAEDRARQTGGTGLGLAIVANAVQQHRGKVSAEKSPLGGLQVKIQLPLWIE